jgi:RimJ/RimL family protein N-acetyltransferase
MVAERLKKPPVEMRTRRLIMRKPRPGDLEVVQRAIGETQRDLRLWLRWAQEPGHERVVAKRYLRREIDKWRAGLGYSYAAFTTKGVFEHRFAGLYTLNVGKPEVPSFTLVYWCPASMQGKGYAAEAVTALTRSAFDYFGARRVQIFCDEQNLKSQQVAIRAGFSREARLKHSERRPIDGTLRNMLLFVRAPYDDPR